MFPSHFRESGIQMTRHQRLGCLYAMAFTLAGFSAPAAEAAPSCPKISYSAERARLQKVLSANAFPRDETAFLLRGVDQQLKEMPQIRLNAHGAECGIQAVRALVLGCVNKTLSEMLETTSRPSAKSGQAYWDKANVSRREAALIGVTHACRSAAMETFLSGS
jgi:hypothetical protein